ncbi:hypothetical protein Z043_124928 [Scleropages formosus]|uniref:SH3 domain-containing protein n=1 Tax=Scleropages formosus TaxID=113540 RepID=A0A0N8JV76_SCLFO|nr:hypothetical protein Z043_124928 [Scleropages formosus]
MSVSNPQLDALVLWCSGALVLCDVVEGAASARTVFSGGLCCPASGTRNCPRRVTMVTSIPLRPAFVRDAPPCGGEPFQALYNYLPRNEDELELKEGDLVDVMERCDDGWFVGGSMGSDRGVPGVGGQLDGLRNGRVAALCGIVMSAHGMMF